MKKVIPFGDRILVKRKKVGETRSSSIVLPDSTKDADTDLAIVVYVPELSFTDEKLIGNSPTIISGLVIKAHDDPKALEMLITFNHYLKLKDLKAGDEIFMGKYVGTTFIDSNNSEELTMVRCDDIIGKVINE